jgi:hydroxylaminobenzene mutase
MRSADPILLATVSWITKAGAIELSLGALSGWIVWLSTDTEVLKRIGVIRPHRILQAHIDLIMMGTILIAVGLAAPDLPKPWSIFFVIGAYTNALLFLPLAWMEKKPKDAKAIIAQAVSFSLVSAGAVATAVYLLSQ